MYGSDKKWNDKNLFLHVKTTLLMMALTIRCECMFALESGCHHDRCIGKFIVEQFGLQDCKFLKPSTSLDSRSIKKVSLCNSLPLTTECDFDLSLAFLSGGKVDAGSMGLCAGPSRKHRLLMESH